MSHATEVEQFFDHEAPRYDAFVDAVGWPPNEILADHLHESPSVTAALDLGAGTGLTTETILNATTAQRVTAVDFSAGMYNLLQERFGYNRRVTLARMAIEGFLAKTRSRFDLVTAMGLFHFLPDPDVAISGVARVIKNDGQFMFTFDPLLPGHSIHGEAHTRYGVTVYRNSPQDIHTSLQQNGFEVLSSHLFAPQPDGNIAYRNGFVVARKVGTSA